jgi:hypothetical protein
MLAIINGVMARHQREAASIINSNVANINNQWPVSVILMYQYQYGVMYNVCGENVNGQLMA